MIAALAVSFVELDLSSEPLNELDTGAEQYPLFVSNVAPYKHDSTELSTLLCLVFSVWSFFSNLWIDGEMLRLPLALLRFR